MNVFFLFFIFYFLILFVAMKSSRRLSVSELRNARMCSKSFPDSPQNP